MRLANSIASPVDTIIGNWHIAQSRPIASSTHLVLMRLTTKANQHRTDGEEREKAGSDQPEFGMG